MLGVLQFHKDNSIIYLGLLTTLFIILGYWVPAADFKYNPNEVYNRALSVIAIWMAVYFVLGQKYFTDQEAKQKEQLAAIFDNASEGMLITNSFGEIVMVNPCAERMFGYLPGQLVGRQIEILIPQRLHNHHVNQRNKFIKAPHNRSMNFNDDLKGQHKAGHEFPVAISLSHYATKKGVYAIAFILDLTEKEKSKENLTTEQHLRQTYFELAPVLFVGLDRAGHVTMINNYGSQLLGYPKQEIIGKNWFENFIPSDIQSTLKALFKDVFNNHTSDSTYENIILNSQGEERHIHWRNTILKTDQDIMVVCAGLDITDRKRHEKIIAEDHNHIRRINEQLEVEVKLRTKELENLLLNLQQINTQLEKEIDERKLAEGELVKSQRLYAAMAHHFPKGIIGVLNKEMEYIFADGQELKNVGLSEPMNIDNHSFNSIYPTLSSQVKSSLLNVFGGESISYDVELDNKTYNISSTPLIDVRNEINEALVVIKDITDRKVLEHNLLKIIEREKELNTMKSQLITMASHEFRTPLTTILSSVFLLERYSGADLEREKSAHLNKIKRAINILNDLLGEFISLGKLDEGKVKATYADVDAKTFIEELITDLETHRKTNQPISYEFMGEERDVLVDKKLLQGIIFNLIGNAIKYSPDDTPIKVVVIVTERNLEIRVMDQGIGIPKEEQHHIFERFYRANNATNIDGSGLGLNIVKKYVQLLNGTIDFRSEINVGTTFTVILPINIYETETLKTH